MLIIIELERNDSVALLTEGVDRNQHAKPFVKIIYVALLTEGVDRNLRT